MSRLRHSFALSLAVPALAIGQPAAPEELPPAALTEQWEPVPKVVRAPSGRPPSDAVVLFDGTGTSAFETVKPDSPGWKIEDGCLVVVAKAGNLRTRESFGDVQLHLEFRTPDLKGKAGQTRGNSGIFFMERYELQILDSYDTTTYVNGQAGSIYKQHPPLVNASRPPLEWQTYDVVFIAPRFDKSGTLVSPARMTVFHNGVLVQHDAALDGPTRYRGTPKYEPHAARLPLVLQDHSDAVSFRNIWVRPLELPSRPDNPSPPSTP